MSKNSAFSAALRTLGDDSEEQFENTVAQALQRFPDLGRDGSPLKAHVEAVLDSMLDDDPLAHNPLFALARWPELVAADIASQLGIAPELTGEARQAFQAAELANCQRSIELYPDAGKEGSELYAAVQAEVARLVAEKSRLLECPEWPIHITSLLASARGILPRGVLVAGLFKN